MDALLALQNHAMAEVYAAQADGVTLSVAITVTDGDAPRTGTSVSLRIGRYMHDDEPVDPDEAAAAEQRRVIGNAIADAVSADTVDVEGLTDDIVAALAGE